MLDTPDVYSTRLKDTLLAQDTHLLPAHKQVRDVHLAFPDRHTLSIITSVGL